MILAPSLLSADFLELGKAIDLLNESPADWIHFDVMDGVFVPNISFGLPLLKAVKQKAKKPIDVHLMVADAGPYIKDFAKAGADFIYVHPEAHPHLHRVIQAIKEEGCRPGIAINPHTPVSTLEEILPEVDLVLLMSVNPGFGGQKFLPSSLQKITKLRLLANQIKPGMDIIVDGGVNAENISSIYQAGATGAVAGNAVFGQASPLDAIRQIKERAIRQSA